MSLLVIYAILFVVSFVINVMGWYGYFQGRFSSLAVQHRKSDSWTSIIMGIPSGIIGPFGIIMAFFMYDHFRYGLKIPFTDPWKGDFEARVRAEWTKQQEHDGLLKHYSMDQIRDYLHWVDNGKKD